MTARDPLADFDYELPAECIAQQPATPRDAARLLVLERGGESRDAGQVRDLSRWLHPGDLLVANATRVRPARLRGHKESGGQAEALLLGPGSVPGRERALLRAGGRLKVGWKLRFERDGHGLDAEIAVLGQGGEVELAFAPGRSPYELGETPVPPYIRRPAPDVRDSERYQTVYAREPGSVAAPTAGLHFTPGLLDALRERGVGWAELVLHVGPGTFRPLRDEDLARGELHPEHYELPAETARAVEETRAAGGRVIAVGTTTTRVLESCVDESGALRPGRGETRLFLSPGHEFRAIDGLLTNFHLPRSSLLLLVAAFAGRERLLDAYRAAAAAGYRFYSYGDAMLIL